LKETLENLSKASYEKQFLNDFQNLDENIKKEVVDALEDLVKNYLSQPWNHPKVKYIPSEGKI